MKSLFFILPLVILFPASEISASRPLPDATSEKLVGGAENPQLLATAKTVKVFRIVDEQQASKPEKTITINRRLCHPEPAPVGDAERQMIIDSVSDITNFGVGYMCLFNPAIVIRFEEGERTLDFVICFRCNEMMLYRDGAIVNRPEFNFSSRKNSFNKEALRAFTTVAKKAFPNDKDIQKLGRPK